MRGLWIREETEDDGYICYSVWLSSVGFNSKTQGDLSFVLSSILVFVGGVMAG